MPEFQPKATAHVAAIKRPGCPKCLANRMLLSKLDAGPGFENGTFECQKCGHVKTMAIARGPIKSLTRGWFASGLRPPT